VKTKSEIVGFLKSNVGSFAGFDEEGLRALVDGSRLVSFEANEAILHYGEKLTAHLGVVLAGSAVAWALDGGTDKTIQRVERGDTFGVMALSVGDATIADLVAESDCQVLLIPTTLLQAVAGSRGSAPLELK